MGEGFGIDLIWSTMIEGKDFSSGARRNDKLYCNLSLRSREMKTSL